MTAKKKDAPVLDRSKELRAYQQEKAKMKKQIDELLKARGWTQAHLAAVLHVDRVTVWRWMNDGKMPIKSLQHRIVELLEESEEGKLAAVPA